MRLTKYQKARLLEFEWDLLDNGSEEDTSWIHIDNQDKHVFDNVRQVLNLSDTTTAVKLLVIATQVKTDE